MAETRNARWTMMITGAQLAPEASALLEAHLIRPVYVDGYRGPETLAAAARDNAVDAILVRQGKIDERVVGASPRLKVIAKHGSGVDNIDLRAASGRNIPVLRALSANARAVAELAISLAMSLLKDIGPLDAAVKGGQWPKTSFVGRDIEGARLSIVGFGEIGRRTAHLARALGMETLAYDPGLEPGIHEGTTVAADFETALAHGDVVSLHCPLTERTRHLIGSRELKLMGEGSFLVNTARGGLVDEDALFDALTGGVIAGAALDSLAQEPPPKDHKLFGAPNLIVTPHIAGASRSALRNMAVQSVTNIVAFLESGTFEKAALANADFSSRKLPT